MEGRALPSDRAAADRADGSRVPAGPPNGILQRGGGRGPGAGTDPQLARAYADCRRMQQRHDPTFWLSTALLPSEVRPAVHALYGFVRTADEIVDGPGAAMPAEQRIAGLEALRRELEVAMGGGDVTEPSVRALVDAGRRHRLPLSELDRYLDSMARDVGPLRIADWADLESYMEGSAGSVGRIMAPLLGVPEDLHWTFARLGLAFQLTNFLRDIPQDRGLDRVYLPADELAAAGAGEDDLDRETATAGLRKVIGTQVERARRLFAEGDPGCREAIPTARRGIFVARSVYEATLDRIESLGFDVLASPAELGLRARVSAMASGFRGRR